MPAPDVTPALPPLVCRDFTSWQLGGCRFVGAYLDDHGRWEVLHLGYKLEEPHGVHATRAAAEAEAQALWVVLAAVSA